MHDPRTPRALNPQALSVLVLDQHKFSRLLLREILRTLMIADVQASGDLDIANYNLSDIGVDVIVIAWEETDAIDALDFVRRLRRQEEQYVCRLPVVSVTSGLTRELVIKGRDAGIDEFLAKPIAPVALKQRLKMVVETPRPFVDCAVYIGPCRRRKNPADYYGVKRRRGEPLAKAPLIDHDELEAKTPIRVALAALRGITLHLRTSDPQSLVNACSHIDICRQLASATGDNALLAALAAFEAYISLAVPMGHMDDRVISTALSALEQLATLPQSYTDARDSVAMALGKAIQMNLAA